MGLLLLAGLLGGGRPGHLVTSRRFPKRSWGWGAQSVRTWSEGVLGDEGGYLGARLPGPSSAVVTGNTCPVALVLPEEVTHEGVLSSLTLEPQSTKT